MGLSPSSWKLAPTGFGFTIGCGIFSCLQSDIFPNGAASIGSNVQPQVNGRQVLKGHGVVGGVGKKPQEPQMADADVRASSGKFQGCVL